MTNQWATCVARMKDKVLNASTLLNYRYIRPIPNFDHTISKKRKLRPLQKLLYLASCGIVSELHSQETFSLNFCLHLKFLGSSFVYYLLVNFAAVCLGAFILCLCVRR